MNRASNIHAHPAIFAKAEEPAQGALPTRAPAPLPLAAGSPTEERLAEELHAMRRWLEGVVHNIGSDPILQRRHAAELSTLKRMAETASELGAVIGCENKEAAIDRVRMPELKARLQRKVIRGLFEVKH